MWDNEILRKAFLRKAEFICEDLGLTTSTKIEDSQIPRRLALHLEEMAFWIADRRPVVKPTEVVQVKEGLLS